MVHQQSTNVDVLIIGSGIIGLTLCNILLKSGYRVGLVDKKIRRDNQTSVSPKNTAWVSALARPGQRLFEKIGIWENLLESAAPYTDMHVALRNGEKIAFSNRDIGQSNLGYIVNNAIMLKLLWDAVSNWDQRLSVFEDQPLSWTAHEGKLELQSGAVCYTTLLIGADGARSWTRSACKIELKPDPCIHDHGYIGVLKHHAPHENRARQVFYDTGVIGLLPTRDPGVSICVWSTTDQCSDSKEAPMTHDIQYLNMLFNQVFQPTEYALDSVWTRRPIHSHQACSYVRENALLVGDAALCLHPLAGQGLNVGLRQVEILAKCIMAAGKANSLSEFGDYANSYQSQCRGYDALSQQVISWCRASMTSTGPIQNLLGFGAYLINKSSLLKRQMIRHALEGNRDLSATLR